MRVTIAIILSIISFGYLLPMGIAIARSRTNTMAIIMMNLFLGWTVIGWIVALIWSVATDTEKKK